MSVETLTNDEGTRRVVIEYDPDHDMPSDWDDCWGQVATCRGYWHGDAHHGVVDADNAFGLSGEKAARYLRIFHDTLVTEIGWARGEWGWVVTTRQDGESVGDWEARHAGNADVWLTYLSGDVYTLTLEERVAWLEERPTWHLEDDDRRTMTTWEYVDSLSGVSDYDYAVSMARQTLESDDDEIAV